MNSRDKKLIALLVSAVIVLGVAVVLGADIYQENSNIGKSSIEYVPNTSVTREKNTKDSTTVADDENITVNNEADEATTVIQQQIVNENSTRTTSSETTTQTNASVNASAMSDSEILAMLAKAINKTKAYTGNVSVKHTESFIADVTECTGGSLVASVANSLVGMVLDPTDETLNFSGGTAVNSDGETVAVLLPQKGNFSLTINGIKSIAASKNGDETVINVSLVSESVSLYEKPAANSAGVGYLDVSALDLSVIEVTSANIVYTGSKIKVHIRPDGYVSYAEYSIPMHIEGTAKSGFVSGSAVFDGKQTEIWQFYW